MPTVDSAGVSIHYELRGSGAPLVMIYGIGGDSADWWDEFPALLAERHTLVMLDNRGTGRSEKPDQPWSMSDMTSDVQAVIDDAGISDFHLLGCSLGTIIARHYVAQRGGSRIRSLSLLCAPNGIQATPEDMQAALFWDPSLPLVESARKSWPIIHPDEWIAGNEADLVADFNRNMADPTPARTFQFQLQAAAAAGDANDAINQHDFPVLVLHGERDRLVPPANGAALAAAIPRSKLVMLEGASHNFWVHQPKAAAEAVLSLTAGVAGAAR